VHAETLPMNVAAQTSGPIRTLIVDDEQFARQRLTELCQAEGDIELIGECSHGAEAVRAIEKLRPDLVLLDVQMRGTSGFDVLRKLNEGAMPLVIFVTAFDQYALGAFEFDAVDYLLPRWCATSSSARPPRARVPRSASSRNATND
jgi:DNA-binding NarL/FixJ family response regulator